MAYIQQTLFQTFLWRLGSVFFQDRSLIRPFLTVFLLHLTFLSWASCYTAAHHNSIESFLVILWNEGDDSKGQFVCDPTCSAVSTEGSISPQSFWLLGSSSLLVGLLVTLLAA